MPQMVRAITKRNHAPLIPYELTLITQLYNKTPTTYHAEGVDKFAIMTKIIHDPPVSQGRTMQSLHCDLLHLGRSRGGLARPNCSPTASGIAHQRSRETARETRSAAVASGLRVVRLRARERASTATATPPTAATPTCRLPVNKCKL